ncbi:MAG: hypothetical protein AAFV74_20020 [Pseudomonadota bacterium]
MLLSLERFSPLLGAAISAAIAWAYLYDWSEALVAQGQDLANAFGPIFDLATFSAGSLFAIYVLALSRAEGFLGRIFETRTFLLFNRYVAHAIVFSVIVAIWTAVYSVVGIGDLSQASSLLVATIWVGTTTCAFISVGRVILIFFVMVGGKTERLSQRL